MAKWQESAWWIDLLNTGLAFAAHHGLDARFRDRFASIRPQDLLPARARAEVRDVSFPIWEIANELIVGAYLEHALGWRLRACEPPGRHQRLGDWEFEAPSGKRIFVEVKSPTELRPGPNAGVFTRGDYAPRLRQVLSRAYQQIPVDDRAALVVLVGDWLLEISHGIMHGDLFAALYGKFEVRIQVMTDSPHVTYAGPSFRDMHVHGSKHRRLGAVAGLITRGLWEPRPLLYVIDNSYAYPEQRVPQPDIEAALRFVVDEDGRGEEKPGITSEQAWARMKPLVYPDDA